ncbi:type VI secretion protein [beta proteobacterium AAP99]|nr:type VI secretion protein [beta proteobacterium AAP99]
MSNFRKVVWTEGLFLQPQHFQQADRHLERWVEGRTNALRPYPWGFTALDIDEDSLKLGRIVVTRAQGVFPDGTPFDAPAVDPLPPALDFPADARDAKVVLSLPMRRTNAQDTSLGGEQDAALMRYVANDIELRDATASMERNAFIQVGNLNLRLMLATDSTEAYQGLALIKVLERKPDSALLVDKNHVPPLLNLHVQSRVAGYLREALAMFHQRGDALAARLGKPGAGGVAEIADFLMLQSVNRYEPLFQHLSELNTVHPERFFSLCVEAIGDLAIFGSTSRRPPKLVAYLHDDLERCLGELMIHLRAFLSTVLEQRAIPIELVDRKYGVRTATVSDLDLLRSANFVLAVNAQVPGEQLRLRFPSQVKIGPVERIRDLVNLQLPGVSLRGLAVAPREIPYHSGFHYFELDRNGDLWTQLQATGHLAMHIAGEFPGLELEFWAIREG